MTTNLLNKRTKVWRLGLSCLLALGVPRLGAAQLQGCLVEPSHIAEIGSAVVGVIERVTFERGDAVRRGQPLVFLKADVEQAATSLASSRAKAEAELRSAQANHDFAQRKLQRSVDLQQQNFISQQALDQAGTEAELAEQKLLQARENQRVLHRELALARAQLAQRTIASPIDGVVLERYVTTGERVEQQTIAKVATLNPLRVEVIVPAAYYNKIALGMSVTIKPDLPETSDRQATVSLVDRVIDTASNSFRVRLELPNPENALPAGVRCKVDFGLATVAKSTEQLRMRRTPAPNANVAPRLPKPPATVAPSPAARLEPGLTPSASLTPALKQNGTPAASVPVVSSEKPQLVTQQKPTFTAPRKSLATQSIPVTKLRLSTKIALGNQAQP